MPQLQIAYRIGTRNPLGRPGADRELADPAASLLADGSAFINGDVITIDGGEWLKGAGRFSLLDQLSGAQALRPRRADQRAPWSDR